MNKEADMNKSVATVVITFNRLKFLKEIIDALRNQSHKPEEIIVINNSSSDGTAEWLAEQKDLIVITQGNVGSSGGQYTGFMRALETDCHWVWTMDDDVVPVPNCLETLLNCDDNLHLVRTPLRYLPSGEPFYNDATEYNLTNPFKSIWEKIMDEDDLKKNIIPAIGITFEGPLMHRSLIEKIGLPEKKFFIYGDDTEYFIRAWKAGYEIAVIRDARFDRKLDFSHPLENINWKFYYVVRNIIAIDVLQGSPAVRFIRPFGYFLKWMTHTKNLKEFGILFKGFIHGYFYRSDN